MNATSPSGTSPSGTSPSDQADFTEEATMPPD